METNRNIPDLCPGTPDPDTVRRAVGLLRAGQSVTAAGAEAFLSWLVGKTLEKTHQAISIYIDPWERATVQRSLEGQCGHAQCIAAYAMQDLEVPKGRCFTCTAGLF
ncbi:MAG: hypothetical protein M3O22_04025 [Pseudomonadota bacterium]|nr:hypothetical protein [Pseudomonadota bacterium]